MNSRFATLLSVRSGRRRHRRPKVCRRTRSLLLEQLEDRRLLAAISWDGGGGNLKWNEPLNWSTDQLPGPGDNVTIDASGNVTVLYDTGSHQIASLNLRDSLQLSGGALTVTGGMSVDAGKTLRVANLDTSLTVTGATIIDGVQMHVSAGATIDLPDITSVTNTGDMTWRAEGLDSRLLLRGLVTLNTGNDPRQDIYIEALDGGKIELPLVTEILDTATASLDQRSVRIKATGPNSVIDLKSLTRFEDRSAGDIDSSHDDSFNFTQPIYVNESSRLEALDGGTLLLGSLTDVKGVYIPVDGRGTLDLRTLVNISDNTELNFSNRVVVDFPQLQTVRSTTFRIDASQVTVPQLSVIDGSDFYITGSATFSLPAVKGVAAVGDTKWQAVGVGSALSFGALTNLNTGNDPRQDIYIEALDGGKIELPLVTEILDTATASLDQRSVRIKATGPNSVIDLKSLTRFEDRSAGDIDSSHDDTFNFAQPIYVNESSRLEALDGGTLLLGSLTDVKGVYIPLGGSGTLDLRTLVNISDNAELNFSNRVVVDFPQLQTVRSTTFRIDASQVTVPQLSVIDGSDFYITGSAKLAFPAVKGLTAIGDTRWQATGVDSVLSFGALTNLNTGNYAGQDIYIEAFGGGRIELSLLTQILDTTTASLDHRSVRIKAKDPNSVIDLSSLTRFEDRSAGDIDSSHDDSFNFALPIYVNESSRLEALDGGTLLLAGRVRLQGVYVPIQPTSTILTGTLELEPTSLLSGTGEISANVINRGTVTVAKGSTGMVIHGDYAQAPQGILSVSVDGPVKDRQYSTLHVNGQATVAGTLQIQRTGSYAPDSSSDYEIIVASELTGRFSLVNGGNIDPDPDLAVHYGSSVAALSRNFDRVPLAELPYENAEANQRVFFDVQQVADAGVSFRVYDPVGNLVTLSNATPQAPDLGDTGPLRLPRVGQHTVRVYAQPGELPAYVYKIWPAPLETRPLTINREEIGAIDTPGKTEQWQFQVSGPWDVTLDVLSIIGAGQRLTFTLQAPDGRTVFRTSGTSDSADTADAGPVKLQLPGTYTLTVDGVGDDTATYQFSMLGPDSPRIRSHFARGSTPLYPPHLNFVFWKAWKASA